MGIDAAAIAAKAAEPAVVAQARRFRGAEDAIVMVGIDRLDYTKGMPRRLLAFEKFLDDEPSVRGRVRLIQVAVPSRTGVQPYRELQPPVEEMVGHINGRFGTPDWTPVVYLPLAAAFAT